MNAQSLTLRSTWRPARSGRRGVARCSVSVRWFEVVCLTLARDGLAFLPLRSPNVALGRPARLRRVRGRLGPQSCGVVKKKIKVGRPAGESRQRRIPSVLGHRTVLEPLTYQHLRAVLRTFGTCWAWLGFVSTPPPSLVRLAQRSSVDGEE